MPSDPKCVNGIPASLACRCHTPAYPPSVASKLLTLISSNNEKGLLRHPACVSELADLSGSSHFLPVIADPAATVAGAHTVVFCSGKTYYDLAAERTARSLDAQFALVRVEGESRQLMTSFDLLIFLCLSIHLSIYLSNYLSSYLSIYSIYSI